MFDLLLVDILGRITEGCDLFLDGAQHRSHEGGGTTFLSVRDGRWRQWIGYHLKLKPAGKADVERDLWSQPMCCFGCFGLVIKLVALVVRTS